MAVRISDKRLEFWENIIANANRIQGRVLVLADKIDNPRQLELLLEIMNSAETIRIEAILGMNKEKENDKFNLG